MHSALRTYIQGLTEINEEKLSSLSSFFKEKEVAKKELLLSEGEVCRYNYFVLKGCLRLYSVNQDGLENTRYIAFEGKFATSFTSLITGQPAIEYIQSLEKSTVLAITKADFFHLVESEPAVNKIYRHILESAYITTQKRIYDLQGTDSINRLKWLLDQQPNVFNRLSNKIIASYLGITPFTLSRLKTNL